MVKVVGSPLPMGGVGIGSGDKYFTVLGQRPSASVSLELLVEIDSLLLLY